VNSALWPNGQPAAPKFGRTCAFPLCRNGAWDAIDRWQANTFALFGIFTDSDFSVEVPSVRPPTGKSGGGAGAFDGTASLAHRVPPGRTVGIFGAKPFGTQRALGVTMAVAFPNNVASSGLQAAPWKFNEWNWVGGGTGGDGIFMFQLYGFSNQFPFDHWMGGTHGSPGLSGVQRKALCNNHLSAATRVAGQFMCTDTQFVFRADPSVYNRSNDWPLGTWGCIEGHYQNLGLSNGAIQMWFTGPAGVRKKIIDIKNMNMTWLDHRNGYNGFNWNNYANVNQAGANKPLTNQTTFRYEDNLHIRAGTPVPCAQIGFGPSGPGGGDTVAPTSPSGIQIR
jgi:hypothetical protein